MTGQSVDDLLRAGDQALYAAKRLGRDRTVLFNAEVIADVVQGEPAADSPGARPAVRRPRAGRDHRRSRLGHRTALSAVGRYARAAAVGLGLPQPEVERIALAGVLHDVGKIGVSDAILRKPGPLDERRVGRDAQAPRARGAHPRRRGPARPRGVGLRPPRAGGRQRLPARPRRRADSAGGAHPRGGRRLRGDDERPSVQRRHDARGGGRGAATASPGPSSTLAWSRRCSGLWQDRRALRSWARRVSATQLGRHPQGVHPEEEEVDAHEQPDRPVGRARELSRR